MNDDNVNAAITMLRNVADERVCTVLYVCVISLVKDNDVVRIYFPLSLLFIDESIIIIPRRVDEGVEYVHQYGGCRLWLP